MKSEPVSFDVSRRSLLDGLRVVDMTRLVAGNLLSLQLGDFGAEIIKVESPGGDPLRDWRTNGKSLYWKTYARNKRSIAIDLHREQGKSLLRRIVAGSDVLIENYRPGTLEKMGFPPDSLLADNPRLIIVRISGFGQTGPYSQLPGFGTLVEAVSGLADRNGFPDREPVLPPLALADMVAGAFGSFAVTAALLGRERGSGKGQVIDLSLLEPLIAILGPEAAIYEETRRIKERAGSGSHTASPRNVYRCSDGSYVALSGSTEAMARRIFEVLGRPEMASDPRFDTNSARVKNRPLVDEFLGDWFAARTREEAVDTLRRADVTVAPVYNIADMLKDAHFQERDVFLRAEDEDYGSVLMNNIVPRLSGTPGVFRRPAPQLGEHTDEILGEIGVDAATTAALRASKIVS